MNDDAISCSEKRIPPKLRVECRKMLQCACNDVSYASSACKLLVHDTPLMYTFILFLKGRGIRGSAALQLILPSPHCARRRRFCRRRLLLACHFVSVLVRCICLAAKFASSVVINSYSGAAGRKNFLLFSRRNNDRVL